MIKGKIHSFESCGTVDGPGLRFVTFMQGCLLRCQYCHNPDSIPFDDFKYERTAEEFLKKIIPYKPFIKNGGVTFSGGEPMAQAEFIKGICELCHQEGIHTAVDTCGHVFNDDVKAALEHVDLVLLDLKAIRPETFKEVTTKPIDNTLKFANYLAEKNIPTWIRFVLVPGLTDNKEEIEELATYVATLKNVEKVEVLPYHNLGEFKWESMGLDYPLKGVKPPKQEVVDATREIFRKHGLKVQ